jgi:hypothetical protein
VSMKRERSPKDMLPELLGHLVKMFEQHFCVTLQKIRDPKTGQEYVNLWQVCEVLEHDVEGARAQLLADPVTSDGVVIFDPDATQPPPMTRADLEAHPIGLCKPRYVPVLPSAPGGLTGEGVTCPVIARHIFAANSPEPWGNEGFRSGHECRRRTSTARRFANSGMTSGGVPSAVMSWSESVGSCG